MDRSQLNLGHLRPKTRTSLWVAFGVFIFLLILGVFFHRFSMRALVAEAHSEHGLVSREVAIGVRELIKSRVRALQIIGEYQSNLLSGNFTQAEFSRLMAPVLKHQLGYYALNWIDANGVIRRVHPFAQNQRAINQNAIEREDIRPYIIGSRRDREPKISHFVDTYQGIKAVTIYVPLEVNGVFQGWINAVMDHRTWFGEFLEQRGDRELYVRMCWVTPFPDNSCFEFGLRPDDWKDPFAYTLPVLNQTLQVESYLHNSRSMLRVQGLNWLLFGVLSVIGILFTWVTFIALRMHEAWIGSLRSLKLWSASLHVLLNRMDPCIAEVNAFVGFRPEAGKAEQELKSRFATLQQDTQKVQKVVSFAQQSHQLLLTEFSLREAVEEVMKRIAPELLSQGVSIDLSGFPERVPKVVADRQLLVDEVLHPLMIGIVNHVDERGTVRIRAQYTGIQVSLLMEAQNRWNNLEKVNQEWSSESTASQIEPASWDIELLRIYYASHFMELFEGQFLVGNEKSKTNVCLVFPRSQEVDDGDRAGRTS